MERLQAVRPIYLDFNATTPIDPRVAKAMQPFLSEHFGNPSSSHAYGVEARQAVEKARGQVADMLGCSMGEVVFTSGGTESNNLAIKGAAFALRDRGNHIITSAVEHPAVLEVCAWLAQQGFQVTYVGVDDYGQVDPQDVERALTPQTALISIMHANNEVGTIQPISEVAQIAHSHNIVMHTDAAQSIAKIAVNIKELGVDMLSVAGHKLYAPKGVGALVIRKGTPLEKMMHGAGHEFGLRAGTENVAGIAGLGEACRQAANHLKDYQGNMRAKRDRLESLLLDNFPWIRVNGHREQRLPNTSSLGFQGLEANTLLAACANVAASAGAACHAGDVKVSHVLQAMRVPPDYAMGTIRFSVGRETRAEEIEQAVDSFSGVIRQMRTGTGAADE